MFHTLRSRLSMIGLDTNLNERKKYGKLEDDSDLDDSGDDGDDGDDSDKKNKRILQFRTITTMINVFQKEDPHLDMRRPMMVTKEKAIEQPARRFELKCLNALALLLVRQHEKVATTRLLNSPDTGRWDFMAIENPRNTQATIITHPTIVDPSDRCIDVLDPLSYALPNSTWTAQTFEDHAHAVADMINHCLSNSFSSKSINNFMVYIIAKSNPKMRRRFSSLSSISIIESLCSINDIPFSPQLSPDPSRPANLDFLQRLPSISSRCHINIPCLLQIGQTQNPTTSLDDVYNGETCTEFHQMLCALLRHFRDSLNKLKFTSPPEHLEEPEPIEEEIDAELESLLASTDHIIFQDTDGSSSEEASSLESVISESANSKVPLSREELESLVNEVLLFGVSLHSIAYSPAMAIHMRLVMDVLGLGRGMAKSYLNWLRLMVSYFEAPYYFWKLKGVPPKAATISIQVVAVPPQGTKMTPWRTVMKDVYNEIKYKKVMKAMNRLLNKAVYGSVYVDAFGKGAPLSTGDGFTGTTHCEGCIHCFRISDSNIDESLRFKFSQSTDQVGVSKRSCPICSHQLQLSRALKFIDSHKTIYPCTPSPSLPLSIMDDMVDHCATELYDIIMAPDEPDRDDALLLDERPSTESQALSSDRGSSESSRKEQEGNLVSS